MNVPRAAIEYFTESDCGAQRCACYAESLLRSSNKEMSGVLSTAVCGSCEKSASALGLTGLKTCCQVAHWRSVGGHKAACNAAVAAAVVPVRERATNSALDAEIGNVVPPLYPERKTKLDLSSGLFKALYCLQTTAYFHMGEFRTLSPRDPERFLATISVLTCISILAVAPNGAAFGAHIPNGALLISCLQSGSTGALPVLMPELRAALRAAFAGVSPANVVVHVVGGHDFTDMDSALRQYFPRRRVASNAGVDLHSFSSHVLHIVQGTLPGAKVDTSLLRLFPGGAMKIVEDEMALIRDGQRFELVALDRVTGSIIALSSGSGGPPPIPPAVRQKEEGIIMGHMSHVMGRPLRKCERT